jgi:putative tryptophan/tyrosine transport system substrate-binding protein
MRAVAAGVGKGVVITARGREDIALLYAVEVLGVNATADPAAPTKPSRLHHHTAVAYARRLAQNPGGVQPARIGGLMLKRAAGAVALALALLGPVLDGSAQTLPRLGLLSIGTDPAKPNPVWIAFLDELGQLGYTEGRTIAIERRFGGGRPDRFPDLIADLSDRKVDVVAEVEALAAKKALPRTPIVMMLVPDPVSVGLVASLARPGGNVTGLTTQAPELYGKRLELLKETLPAVERTGMLLNLASASTKAAANGMESAARVLGLQIRRLDVRDPAALDGTFGTIQREHIQAVVIVTDGVMFNQRARIADLGVKSRVPTMCEVREFVVMGCLVAYGPSYGALSRRAAVYVDKILKGAKPADLPVEQPTKFELVINLKTAKALGLTIPQSVLLRADEIIQ